MENEITQQEVEKVTLDEVIRQDPKLHAREVPPLTRIGYKLALFLLGYIAIVTIVVLAEYFLHAPTLPCGPSLNEAQLGLYQQLSQISTERTLKLLDALVLKGFLPVLTAVLGYIFGTRGADRGDA
jgi:hypothetical protein